MNSSTHLWPRIIPADAGSTCLSAGVTTSGWDHPRGCGEHLLPKRAWRCGSGSSPRMRGALDLASTIYTNWGIIPADAGSTVPRPSQPEEDADHPRGCGEHRSMFCCRFPSLGSSPRMRGAQRSATKSYKSLRDHPRGCGEHLLGSVLVGLFVGSSPRMRGALCCKCVL